MTDTSPELAAARRLIHDGAEICALVGQNIAAAADREGRQLEPADFGRGIAPLLAAAWQLAKMTHVDETKAKSLYVDLLRRHADRVEVDG